MSSQQFLLRASKSHFFLTYIKAASTLIRKTAPTEQLFSEFNLCNYKLQVNSRSCSCILTLPPFRGARAAKLTNQRYLGLSPQLTVLPRPVKFQQWANHVVRQVARVRRVESHLAGNDQSRERVQKNLPTSRPLKKGKRPDIEVW